MRCFWKCAVYCACCLSARRNGFTQVALALSLYYQELFLSTNILKE